MKRLGIFLGFTPRQLVPHEGISRLIGFIVNGAVHSKGVSVTIAGPSWLKREIIELLDDAGVPKDAVKIVTTRGEPGIVKIWRVWDRMRRRNDSRKTESKVLKRLASFSAGVVSKWLSTRSNTLLIVGGMFALLLAMVFFIPALAVATVLASIYGMRTMLKSALRKPKGEQALQRYRAARRQISNSLGLVDRVREGELARLIRKLNSKDETDVWYVPSMFWPEVRGLNGKVVMAAPDIVFFEHPTQYVGDDFKGALERITASLSSADHLITYSQYVKDEHIVARQKIQPSRVTVIPHGVINTAAIERGDGSKASALEVLHKYLKEKRRAKPDYLDGFRFDDVPFLFYSSQVRPHKNIEGLIAVYERILRQHYKPIKLVLTGKISGNDRIMEYVESRGLQRDVISLPAVPNEVLASLYRLALLSVNPTMFEGGFPFTFAEAYSVGTPSVMSRIPVVTEMIQDEKLLKTMTFDPRDREEMLEKILWGIDNADELFAAQRTLFDQMSSRTWSKVADEYLALMHDVATH